MATPPFNFDTGSPTATSDISAYPANEQTFRDVVKSASAVLVDATTGLGPIITSYTTTTRDALVNLPTGLFIYNTTAGGIQLNTGTPGSPTWTSV
jgi:hypothetical protein